MKNDSNEKVIEKEAGTKLESTSETVSIEEVQKSHQDTQLDDLWSMLRENNSFLKEIKSIIQERLEYDAVKEKAFDKLYEDMRQQRELPNILDRNIKPLLTDLLLLYDNMKHFEISLTIQQSSNSETILQDFKYLLDDLLETLYRQEVIPIEDDGSGNFNSKIHKATRTEATETQDEDFKIVDVVRQGFLWRDKVLRPQEVVIRRFENKG
jgi:molecular chaperone GrpE (heat shock protein)